LFEIAVTLIPRAKYFVHFLLYSCRPRLCIDLIFGKILFFDYQGAAAKRAGSTSGVNVRFRTLPERR
jgi:hypothetical protein